MIGHGNDTLSKMRNALPSAKWMSMNTRSGKGCAENHSTVSSTDCKTCSTVLSGDTSPSKWLSRCAAMASSSMITTFFISEW